MRPGCSQRDETPLEVIHGDGSRSPMSYVPVGYTSQRGGTPSSIDSELGSPYLAEPYHYPIVPSISEGVTEGREPSAGAVMQEVENTT